MKDVHYNMLDGAVEKIKEPMFEIMEAKHLIEEKEEELSNILKEYIINFHSLSYHHYDSSIDQVLIQFEAENKDDIFDSYFIPISQVINYLQTHSERPVDAMTMIKDLKVKKWIKD